MKRFMKRGYKQNRMRHIWKTIREFYKIADGYDNFTELCCNFYYSDASSDVDMPMYLNIIKTVGSCR